MEQEAEEQTIFENPTASTTDDEQSSSQGEVAEVSITKGPSVEHKYVLLTFDWEIDSPNILNYHAPTTTTPGAPRKKYRYVGSTPYELQLPGGKSSEWRMVIDPNYMEGGKRYLGLMVYMTKLDWTHEYLDVLYELQLLSASRKIITRKASSIRRFSQAHNCHGWLKFLPYSYLEANPPHKMDFRAVLKVCVGETEFQDENALVKSTVQEDNTQPKTSIPTEEQAHTEVVSSSENTVEEAAPNEVIHSETEITEEPLSQPIVTETVADKVPVAEASIEEAVDETVRSPLMKEWVYKEVDHLSNRVLEEEENVDYSDETQLEEQPEQPVVSPQETPQDDFDEYSQVVLNSVEPEVEESDDDQKEQQIDQTVVNPQEPSQGEVDEHGQILNSTDQKIEESVDEKALNEDMKEEEDHEVVDNEEVDHDVLAQVIRDVVADLWETKAHANTQIICASGALDVHSYVLKARSPIFRAHFEAKGETASFDVSNVLNSVSLSPKKTVDLDLLKGMLEYCYTGNTASFSCFDKTTELLLLAKELQVDSLTKRCTEELMKKVAFENVEMIYDLVNYTRISSDADTVFTKRDFLRELIELREANPEVLRDLAENAHGYNAFFYQ